MWPALTRGLLGTWKYIGTHNTVEESNSECRPPIGQAKSATWRRHSFNPARCLGNVMTAPCWAGAQQAPRGLCISPFISSQPQSEGHLQSKQHGPVNWKIRQEGCGTGVGWATQWKSCLKRKQATKNIQRGMFSTEAVLPDISSLNVASFPTSLPTLIFQLWTTLSGSEGRLSPDFDLLFSLPHSLYTCPTCRPHAAN